MLTLLSQALIKRCDPNEDDCSDILDREFKSYGVNNLGWSSLFKILAPELTGVFMFWYAYDDDKVKKFEYKKIESSNLIASDLLDFISLDAEED